METINVFEWFEDKNKDNGLISLKLEKKHNVSIVVSFTAFREVCLSDYFIKDDSEIRFEAMNIRNNIDKYFVQIFVYMDNNLVMFENTYKFNFI